MTPRRRALLLLALALLLGALAAASVRRREAALARALGPEPARARDARAGAGGREPGGRPAAPAHRCRAATRRPTRSRTRRSWPGARLAVALPAGSILTASVLRAPGPAAEAALAPGERVADVVAHGDPRAVVPGARVDVLVTRDGDGTRAGTTTLALQDVEVLDARPAPAGDDAQSPSGGARVAATLRVRVRDAVYLAAAQAFARDIRLLVRSPGDRGRDAGLAFDERLR